MIFQKATESSHHLSKCRTFKEPSWWVSFLSKICLFCNLFHWNKCNLETLFNQKKCMNFKNNLTLCCMLPPELSTHCQCLSSVLESKQTEVKGLLVQIKIPTYCLKEWNQVNTLSLSSRKILTLQKTKIGWVIWWRNV